MLRPRPIYGGSRKWVHIEIVILSLTRGDVVFYSAGHWPLLCSIALAVGSTTDIALRLHVTLFRRKIELRHPM